MYKILGDDQKEYGPVNANQLRQWLREGRVNQQTRVQVEGSSEWQPLAAVPELAAVSNATAPPINRGSTPASGGAGINALVPYKNPKALIAYYLAVFSLIPFLGMPLGLAAFVLGILGLRFRRTHPTAGGSVHAWIGIVLGGLFGFGYLALILLAVFAAVANSR